MIWVTHFNPAPGDETLNKENFTGWKYAVDAGVLTLTKGHEKVIFGPGFWVRIDDDTEPKKQAVTRIR
ncbi:hypothetical protein MINTM001_24740 [Mycobacterium paraintracellulare]|uniref:hypothetical protein n=1 Tax=Mycobacterium paraintracellulare TaxID=1138383 RepID=UPI0019285F42|nr:hypothetical protein [Mycobacterium paraintracellulare]BCO41335.1 hypothetical protein MINTM001_24740 [Mycobacterium paraintracellulare]